MSNGINKAILLGHVGNIKEERYTPDGRAVANFSVATNYSYKDKLGVKQESTEWHNIVCFGKLAEIIFEYMKKGMQVYVEGKMRTSEYENKGGVKTRNTEIVANEVLFLGSQSPQNEPH